ncbi:MAG TPA: hypothetical protein VKB57_23590 [Acidimicrobiales bacterium]|nr:hypothetical protein [Acidimicrobiales bacterium]
MAEMSCEYQFSSATTEPPTGSQIRLDNADPTLASKLWVRNLTTPGEDIHTLLLAWPAGTLVYVQDYDDHTRYVAYATTGAAVDKTDYVEFPVAWDASGLPLLTQKVSVILLVKAAEPTPPGPPVPVVAYATVDELAAALRIRVTPENTDALQACLDAAAIEIDHDCDRFDGDPIPADNALANRVNIARGVEWFKAQDASFGVIGSDQTGTLTAPRDQFNRYAYTLTPLKQQWGIA